MCGIVGVVNFVDINPDHGFVRRAMNVMRHRGPDGEGIFNDRHVSLGHVRLSIIDVEGSKQPLSNEDESIWVTFNGEIYNYQEIRRELINRGHIFRTHGDTETLVHLYEEYGENLVGHLQGMFAFALWDKKKKHLLLFRDRMGIKPLYYCWNKESLIFASEPKAILQHTNVSAALSPEGLWHYLTYRTVPSPGTLFEGINKLKPGHMLFVTSDRSMEKPYWDIPLCSKNHTSAVQNEKNTDFSAKVESLLFTSVKRRLISDVPLGAFLSGGVDSSLIVAIMSQLSTIPVRTYSVGFKDFSYSETPFAKIVAEYCKTNHNELILEEDYFADNLEKLTWIRDSPLSEPADIPLYLLAKMASKDVKVLLSGEGSDELFAGYPKYAYDKYSWILNWLPTQWLHTIAVQMPQKYRRAEVALRSLCEKDSADRWAQWFSPFTQIEKSRLFQVSESWSNPSKPYADHAKEACLLDAMLYTDCKVWLPENLLDRGDRMTMGASVEGRVPFLDHELVELAFHMPPRMKLRGFSGKWLIKQIASKYLPSDIVHRRKAGFVIPLSQWFRGKLREMCYDRICERNGLISEILDRQEITKILDEHCSGRKDNTLKIWTLLGLALWSDIFIHKTNAIY